MGRTQRNRAKKRSANRPQLLDHEPNIINLRKFMTRNGFIDEINLKLCNFPTTGRGVATTTSLNENDILIRIPYSLMITYATLQTTNFLHFFTPTCKLTIHDLLAAFLVLERHKKDSFWGDYVNSLPSEPPWLPALLSEEHIELFPLDLRLAVKKSRRTMEESWTRVRKSIRDARICGCGCGKNVSCVINLHSFMWGFVMVNTRGVYVNPGVVKESGLSEILSDEPCMALCPFLDMFNHSFDARTRAELVKIEGSWVYQLTTLMEYKRHEQVFISYGGHDNVKLLVEYGFFIPGNPHDCVVVSREEAFEILGLSLSDFQYKFICSHGLDKSLYISENGPSFNLKGLLFVSWSSTSENLASIIYNENYPEFFTDNYCKFMCQKLLEFFCESFTKILTTLETSQINPVMTDFSEYRRNFIRKLRDNNKQ